MIKIQTSIFLKKFVAYTAIITAVFFLLPVNFANADSHAVDGPVCADKEWRKCDAWCTEAGAWCNARTWQSHCDGHWYNIQGFREPVECCSNSDCDQGEKCIGSDADRHCVNKHPVGFVRIPRSRGFNDYMPSILGYAYDPAVDSKDREEKVKIKIVYNGSQSKTYSTSYTNKLYSTAPCSDLSRRCGFMIALDERYLHSGYNSIKVYAIDPDTKESVLLASLLPYFRTNISCQLISSMPIYAYTFNRPNKTERWQGCRQYALSKKSSGGFIKWRTSYSAWPSTWPRDGDFDNSKNLGIRSHLKGGGNAYTLGIYKYSTIRNINGENFSGSQKCLYITQDYVGARNNVTDSYYFRSSPACVALGANKTVINYGEEIKLAWEHSGLDSANLSGVGSVGPNGSVWLSPSRTTTYTLTGTIGNIEVKQSKTIYVAYRCTGSIPSHASAWGSDENVGLTNNLPWRYSSSDTSRKCEYRCDAGYVWNGSRCVAETLSVSLSANPSSGNAPLTTTLTARVSGTAGGTINYTFWNHCNSNCNSVSSCQDACGNWNGKYNNQTSSTKSHTNTYSSAGIYHPKVIVERGSLTKSAGAQVDVVCGDTCSSLGYECGTHTICGNNVNCGRCPSGFVCKNGQCVKIPTADIKANGSDGPITVDFNTSVNISWSSTDATSCSVSPGNWKGTSGSEQTDNLIHKTTYNLTCVGFGGEATDSVTINVNYPFPFWKEIAPE